MKILPHPTIFAICCGVMLAIGGSAWAQSDADLDFGDEELSASPDPAPAATTSGPTITVDTSVNAAMVPTIAIPTIEEIDRTGVKTFREEFEPGSVKRRYEARTKNGIRVKHGNFAEYYPTGKKFIVGRYRNGAPHGEWTYFHENGTVAKQGVFVDGRLYGKWTIRRDDGVLVREDSYENGNPHGLEVIYFPDGKSRMFERLYLDGQPAGTWMAWYHAKQMIFKIEFKDGKKNGEMVQWYPNGKVQSTGTYRNDMRHGTFTLYSQQGELVRETRWDNDERVTIKGSS